MEEPVLKFPKICLNKFVESKLLVLLLGYFFSTGVAASNTHTEIIFEYDAIGNRIQVTNVDVADIDQDGILDSWELEHFGDLNHDMSQDSDGDGLTDLEEYQAGTLPLDADTDGDGMSDGWEVLNNLDPTADDASGDADNDGTSNFVEYILASAGYDVSLDTDGDGVADVFEANNGLNPLNASDVFQDDDNNGLPNDFETFHNLTDGVFTDTDGDGFTIWQEYFARTNDTDPTQRPSGTLLGFELQDIDAQSWSHQFYWTQKSNLEASIASPFMGNRSLYSYDKSSESILELWINATGEPVNFYATYYVEGNLSFYIDDVKQGEISSGEYQLYEFPIAEGKAKLTWKFTPAGNGSSFALIDNLFVPAYADSDADGVKDGWEYHYFGELGRDLSQDYDNDGVSDLDEYHAETDPLIAGVAAEELILDEQGDSAFSTGNWTAESAAEAWLGNHAKSVASSGGGGADLSQYVKYEVLPTQGSGNALVESITGTAFTLPNPLVWNEDGSVTGTGAEKNANTLSNAIMLDFSEMDLIGQDFIYVIDVDIGPASQGAPSFDFFKIDSELSGAAEDFTARREYWGRGFATSYREGGWQHNYLYNDLASSAGRSTWLVHFDHETRDLTIYKDGNFYQSGNYAEPLKKNSNTNYGYTISFGVGGPGDKYYGSSFLQKSSFTDAELQQLVTGGLSGIAGGGSGEAQSEESVYQWDINVGKSGRYQVYATWQSDAENSMTTPYTISDINGLSEILVDQTDPALSGQWNLLGEFDFDVNELGYVSLSSKNGPVSADAIRLVEVLPGDPLDVDQDGILDAWELEHFGDLNHDMSQDSDGDGLTDLEEYQAGTLPVDADTDGDGMSDGWEVLNNLDPTADDASGDADNDGTSNFVEYILATWDYDVSIDTDGDGVADVFEANNGLNPLNASDVLQDDDNNGLPNDFETFHNLTDGVFTDTDGDGFTIWQEYFARTSDLDGTEKPSGSLLGFDKPDVDSASWAASFYWIHNPLWVSSDATPYMGERNAISPDLLAGETAQLELWVNGTGEAVQFYAGTEGTGDFRFLVDDVEQVVMTQGAYQYYEVPLSSGMSKLTWVFTANLDTDKALLDNVYIPALADSDTDGVKDGWEYHYFGELSRDLSQDYDNDGVSDLDEYHAKTDPIVASLSTDIYYYNLGDGQVNVNSGEASDEVNQVVFGEGITQSDIRFSNDSENVVLTLLNAEGEPTSDSITLVSAYTSEDKRLVNGVLFTDQSAYNWVEILARSHNFYGTDGNDEYRALYQGSFYGLAGDDLIVGSSGHDLVFGGEGDDTLYGGEGHDIIEGGPGNDTLYFGVGSDIVNGGEGDDTYVFNLGNGYESIGEYIPNDSDSLLFGANIYSSDLQISNNGYSIVIQLLDDLGQATNDKVVLTGAYTDVEQELLGGIVFETGGMLSWEEIRLASESNN